MIEQIFDCIGIYPVARAIRGWNKFWVVGKGTDEWEEAYRKEEFQGHELLQRQNRLEKRRTEILSQAASDEESQLEYHGGKPSRELPDELYRIDEQLNVVGHRYSDHRQKMKRLCSIADDDSWVRDVLMSQKPQYSFIPGRDKPYYWIQKKKFCAASGGCCSFKCGCCEKPLSWWSPSLPGSKNKEGGQYAHCTAECGCCIKRSGGYEPTPQNGCEDLV